VAWAWGGDGPDPSVPFRSCAFIFAAKLPDKCKKKKYHQKVPSCTRENCSEITFFVRTFVTTTTTRIKTIQTISRVHRQPVLRTGSVGICIILPDPDPTYY
jgi:hypothetical protein